MVLLGAANRAPAAADSIGVATTVPAAAIVIASVVPGAGVLTMVRAGCAQLICAARAGFAAFLSAAQQACALPGSTQLVSHNTADHDTPTMSATSTAAIEERSFTSIF
ncbi:MAG TPA: hypothetical protein VE178_19210 [Silvibacterium sp.]|nr:hypothetical protein [Silvibacterium sp.]